MKNILIYIINFSFLLTASCSSGDVQMKVSPKVQYADLINAKTSKQLKKERSLYCLGTGGNMLELIEVMYLAFQFFAETTLSEKREQAVYAVETYLANVNSCEEIKSYLANDPFLIKNIEIDIAYYNPDRSNLPEYAISFVSAKQGAIKYYSHKDKGYRVLELEETFEEAKQKLIEDQTKPKIVKVNPLRNFLECLLLG